ncbi:MAG: CRTAC1 family protein, partial [Candidatus Binatia bacterium]
PAMIANLLLAATLAAAAHFDFVAAAIDDAVYANVSGDADQLAILEQNGQGVCAFDADGDGLLDLYFPNGSARARLANGDSPGGALLRNRGSRAFENVTDRAGLRGPAWATGCTAADYDADGWTDLLVLGWRDSRLYRNQGDGRFEDVSRFAGVDVPGWASSAAFADLDGDGLLDVAVSRYVSFDFGAFPTKDRAGRACDYRGVPAGCPPLLHEPQSTLVFRQHPGGRFEPAAASAGLASPTRGFGILALPLFAASSRPDLYVACDQMENRLFLNRSTAEALRFEEAAGPMGAAVGADGRPESGMGLAVGDVWEDGRPDLFLTNFAGEKNTLYRNLGSSFVDATSGTGLDGHRSELGWGNALADLDADSHLDALVVNGHIYPQVERLEDPADRYAQPIRLYAGDGAGGFQEVTPPPFAERRSRRGLAVADFDDDGRLDLVAQTHRGPPQIFWNRSAPEHHWIRFRLDAARGAPAIGAKLVVELPDGSRRTAWNIPNQGYQSSHDPRVTFGLGRMSSIRSLEILWPDGTVDRRASLAADADYVVARARAPEAARDAGETIVQMPGSARGSRIPSPVAGRARNEVAER